MKHLSLLLALLLVIPVFSLDNPQPKKFKVTFTVVYNELTLEQAAAKEKEFRERYKDACAVDVGIENIDNRTLYVNPENRIWLYNDNMPNYKINPDGSLVPAPGDFKPGIYLN